MMLCCDLIMSWPLQNYGLYLRQLSNDVYLSLIILTIVLLNQIDRIIIIFSYYIIFQRFEDFPFCLNLQYFHFYRYLLRVLSKFILLNLRRDQKVYRKQSIWKVTDDCVYACESYVDIYVYVQNREPWDGRSRNYLKYLLACKPGVCRLLCVSQ